MAKPKKEQKWYMKILTAAFPLQTYAFKGVKSKIGDAAFKVTQRWLRPESKPAVRTPDFVSDPQRKAEGIKNLKTQGRHREALARQRDNYEGQPLPSLDSLNRALFPEHYETKGQKEMKARMKARKNEEWRWKQD